jgi:hypothetical protein
MIELKSIAILSTAHLHPLEANQISDVSTISGDSFSLVNADVEMYEFYISKNMPMLVDLIKEVVRKYGVTYVLFDPDANVSDEFRSYEW